MVRLSSVIGLILAMVFSSGGLLQAADQIKVGIVDCYSGPPSTYTNDVRDGFKFAVDRINAKGGVLGKKIVFVTRDDKFEVSLGLSAAKELIMREKVDLLMGTINSAAALAISDLCKEEKVPFLVTYSKSHKIAGEKGHRYVFMLNESTSQVGKGAAVALSKKPYVNYWIAGDDYEYGHAVADDIWNHLKALKPEVKILGQSWWKRGEPDFTPYITSILSAKPDCVIVATGGSGCVPFLKAAKATGFNERVPFFMHTAAELSTLRPLGLEAPEGVLASSNYQFYFPNTPENKEFTNEFKKAYGRYPSWGTLIGYVTAQFIEEAYKKAGKVDREKFVDAMEGMTVASPMGKIEMRKYDHQLMLPLFVGTTKKVPEYDFLIATDIQTIPAEQAMPSVEEMKKMREGK